MRSSLFSLKRDMSTWLISVAFEVSPWKLLFIQTLILTVGYIAIALPLITSHPETTTHTHLYPPTLFHLTPPNHIPLTHGFPSNHHHSFHHHHTALHPSTSTHPA